MRAHAKRVDGELNCRTQSAVDQPRTNGFQVGDGEVVARTGQQSRWDFAARTQEREGVDAAIHCSVLVAQNERSCSFFEMHLLRNGNICCAVWQDLPGQADRVGTTGQSDESVKLHVL